MSLKLISKIKKPDAHKKTAAYVSEYKTPPITVIIRPAKWRSISSFTIPSALTKPPIIESTTSIASAKKPHENQTPNVPNGYQVVPLLMPVYVNVSRLNMFSNTNKTVVIGKMTKSGIR